MPKNGKVPSLYTIAAVSALKAGITSDQLKEAKYLVCTAKREPQIEGLL